MADKGANPQLKVTAREIFSGLARSYELVLDVATLWQDRYWKSWLIRELEAKRGDRLLDVGCGTLLLEELLAGSGCEVVGVDLTQQMLQVGKEKSLANVSLLVRGDGELLPFSDKTFDSAVSCYVPKYVDIRTFARELGRVVRPGGKVVLYDFVRPRGPLMPVLSLYEQGGMRIAGRLLELAKRDSAITFRRLPQIVKGATWHESIGEVFTETGFRTLNKRTLSGGVVGAYAGARLR